MAGVDPLNRILQEKFEVHSEPKSPGPEGWVSDASARDTNMMPPRHTISGRFQSHRERQLQRLPPGEDITDQEMADITEERMAGGLGSGTQATEDVTVESLKKGYAPKKMRPTDDQYSNEHQDAFYNSVVLDGVEGYVERNNYLDRE